MLSVRAPGNMYRKDEQWNRAKLCADRAVAELRNRRGGNCVVGDC